MARYVFPDTKTSQISPNASPLVNRLLANREVSPEEVHSFLSPDYDTELHDPFLLSDMPVAVERIKAAIDNQEQIAIFSDYDCDGIPGAVILHDLFKALEYDNFQNYIPHRHYEGFGLSSVAIDKLAADGVKLVITIDCGTNDVEVVEYAKEKGIDIIVTDHHEPADELPPAVAIVNPKLGEYPFPHLCGAAVAYKLAQAMLSATSHSLVPGQEKWWLDMVGIATIADMVPLRGENRVLAQYGLTVLRKSRRPGIQQLLRKQRINQSFLSEEDIGFSIGPRINAASRMDTPEDAFELLATKDVVKAGERLNRLEDLNKERKSTVAVMTRQLHQRLKKLTEVPSVLVFGSPDWRPSLVGLAANKLAEEHQRPVFIWGKDGNGMYKGSCRSGGTASVVELMNAANELFVEHGGHHASGGFTVKDEHIHTFAQRLQEVFEENKAAIEHEPELLIDEYLQLSDVTDGLIKDLERLAPYGTGNPKPLFAFKDVQPELVETFGKGKEHLKLKYQHPTGTLEAIAFFAAPTSYKKAPKVDETHTLIAHAEKSFFMGRAQLRLRIVDIL